MSNRVFFFFAAVVLVAASGCSKRKPVAVYRVPVPSNAPSASPSPVPSTTPSSTSLPASSGPTSSGPASESGIASWYGHPYHGRASASGEIYDMETLTAAHRTLPFGTVVRVTNLANSESVDVRVIDRGPFVDGRIIDLSHAAAAAIHLIGPGTGMVRVDIISMPTQDPESNVFTVQAGAFQDRDRAERLRSSLEGRYGWACLVERQGRVAQWRVLVGKQTTIGRANALAHRLRAEVGPAFVVRLDDSALSGATTRSGQ